MKKIIIISALVFILCGCSLKKDKYSNYEHYNLNNYNHKTYKYIRDYEGAWHDIKTEEYAVSSLCPIGKNEDICEDGLLYNVGDYDFILLDKFSGCDGSASDEKETVFYKDKIYILRSFASIIEYTLNKENTEKKELKFDLSPILEAETLNYYFSSIEELDDESIIVNGSVSGYNKDKPVGDIRSIFMKCSLTDYKCVKYSG